MSRKNKSGYELHYPNFEYKGYKEDVYIYDVPFEDYIEAAREYFSKMSVNLDGTDTAIWKVLYELNGLDNLFEIMEDWLLEYCKPDAEKEFKDWVDWYYSDEE